MEKHLHYDINNFYIGELIYSTPIALNMNNSMHVELVKLSNNVRNKVVICKNSGYIDYDKMIRFDSALVLFYKNNNKLFCLHNNYEYDDSNFSLIKNLTPVKELLPFLHVNLLESVTSAEIFYVYRLLVDKCFINSAENLYDNLSYSFDDFFVGNVSVLDSYLDNGKLIYTNLPQNYVLDKSSAKFIDKVHCKSEINSVFYDCDFSMYKCLLLNYGKFLINLNDNRVFNKNGLISNSTGVDSLSKCENEISFDSFLRDNNYEYGNSNISVKKALSLFKKYNK